MYKYFLLFLFGFCHYSFAQQNVVKSSKEKFVTFQDTGFIIYTQPHFKGLFLSTKDISLNSALSSNKYLQYFHTYNEDFKKFIIENDTIPKFIKNDKNVYIYNFGRLDQISINYFRAVVTIKIPITQFQYVKPTKEVKKRYYLENIKTKKITFLHEFIRSDLNIFECIEYKLI